MRKLTTKPVLLKLSVFVLVIIYIYYDDFQFSKNLVWNFQKQQSSAYALELALGVPKSRIHYSDHDKSLQKQLVNLNDNKNETIFIWRAICDERVGAMKLVMVFVYTLSNNIDFDQYNSNIKCLINGVLSSDFNNTFIHYDEPGFFVFCPFEVELSCPEKVSIQFGNQTVTNEIEIERQFQKISGLEEKKMSLTLCLPSITRPMETFEPYQLTEYFEYQRLAGIDRVLLAELNETFYNFSLNANSKKVLQFYKDSGFLETYHVSLMDNKRDSYRLSDITKRAQFTYCMVKTALISDYAIVHDFDEVVGFNSNTYKNLPDAISAAADKNYTYSSFFLKDEPIARKCNFSSEIEGASNFVLLKSELFFRDSFNPGKSIHSSQTCQIAWHHHCSLIRKENSFSKFAKNYSTVPVKKFSIFLDLHSEEGINIMRSFHSRIGFPDDVENLEEICHPDRTEKLNWLNNLSEKLLENCLKVLEALNLQ